MKFKTKLLGRNDMSFQRPSKERLLYRVVRWCQMKKVRPRMKAAQSKTWASTWTCPTSASVFVLGELMSHITCFSQFELEFCCSCPKHKRSFCSFLGAPRAVPSHSEECSCQVTCSGSHGSSLCSPNQKTPNGKGCSQARSSNFKDVLCGADPRKRF